jgi:cobalt/nickel transport system permease protein
MGHIHIEPYVEHDSLIHRLDARVKLIGGLFFIGCVLLTPPAHAERLLAYGGVLLFITVLSELGIGSLLFRAALVLPFVAIAALGLLFGGAKETFYFVFARTVLCVFCALLLTATTPFAQIVGALRWLRVPSLFVTLRGFIYRYFFVFIEEGQRMRRAYASRSPMRGDLRHAKSFGKLIGALMLRTYERSERIHAAMLARGFDGDFRTLPTRRLRVPQAACLVGFAVVLLLIQGVVR